MSFEDWTKIDVAEEERGIVRGKPREKIVSVPEMMDIVGS